MKLEFPAVFMICDLPRTEVVRRINAAIESSDFVCGRANKECFGIRKKRSYFSRYVTGTVMLCNLYDDENGTIIRCDFKRIISIKMIVAFLAITVTLTTLYISAIILGKIKKYFDINLGAMRFSIFLPIGIISIPIFRRFSLIDDNDSLKNFIKNVTAAREY